MDDYHYTARWQEILTTCLPKASFPDAFLVVNQVRMVKSDKEKQYMKEAGTIAAAIVVAQPGTRQCDVITELNKFNTAGTPAIGGTFTCTPPKCHGWKVLQRAKPQLD